MITTVDEMTLVAALRDRDESAFAPTRRQTHPSDAEGRARVCAQP